MIDQYEWGGRREAMLRFGPATGPIVVVALPLFEEANRVRTCAVTMCRMLARRGVASALSDVPGQGESLTPLEDCELADMTGGYEHAVQLFRAQGRAVYGAAFRSGALLYTSAPLKGRWQCSPQDGASLVRDLTRIKQASFGRSEKLGASWYLDTHVPNDAQRPLVEIAGNRIASSLMRALSVDPLSTGEVRTVRLDTERKPADRYVPGVPLWRRAEPDTDPALAAVLADDIADWIARCEG